MMGYLAPTIALSTCEQALRDLYARAYAEAFGADWLDRIATPAQRSNWQRKGNTERKKRTSAGAAAISEDELAYADFPELGDIAESHWEPLFPALGEKAQTLPLLRRFQVLRNTVAHSRPLLPFEEDLLSGIAGEIRNRVTIYMTGKDPSGGYFARIESITDSYGHAIAPNESQGVLPTAFTVYIGDVVHFTCRGTDPQNRPLSWRLLVAPGGSIQSVTGADATLSWTVENANVSQETNVGIIMTSASTHHRIMGEIDGNVTILYRVLPR